MKLPKYTPYDKGNGLLQFGMRRIVVPAWKNRWHFVFEIDEKLDTYLTYKKELYRFIDTRNRVHQDPNNRYPYLKEIAMMVQEDLCMMRFDGTNWRLDGASVCFPSFWDLNSTIGKTLDQIHFPVPNVDSVTGKAITRRLQNLKGDAVLERFNWTITDTSIMYQPEPKNKDLAPKSSIDHLYLRVERQTFTKVDENTVLFTIRTYMDPVRSISTDLFLCSALRDTLNDTDPLVLKYRGIDRYYNLLLDTLNTWAAAHSI